MPLVPVPDLDDARPSNRPSRAGLETAARVPLAVQDLSLIHI